MKAKGCAESTILLLLLIFQLQKKWKFQQESCHRKTYKDFESFTRTEKIVPDIFSKGIRADVLGVDPPS